MKEKIIAIDFDGCICQNAWPEIGEPNREVIQKANEEKKNGAKIILWTCRNDEMLLDAIESCGKWGLTFDAINQNLPGIIDAFGRESRKVYADEYWDDKAVLMPTMAKGE